MYFLVMTVLIITNGQVEFKQTNVDRFGIIEECASYKRKIEKTLPEDMKNNIIFDCRRIGV